MDSLIWSLIKISIVFAIAGMLWSLLKFFLAKWQTLIMHRYATNLLITDVEAQKRAQTLMDLVRLAIRVAVILTAIFMALSILGIDVKPLLASAGIVGLAIGFGAQSLVKDFFSGFFILLEDQVRVGDVVAINGTSGTVEQINFKTTVLRDLAGTVHFFSNGSITSISNMTKDWSAYIFDISVAYRSNVEGVIDIIKTVGIELRRDRDWKEFILEDLEIFGLDRFAESAVTIKGRIKTQPTRQWEVGREFLKRLKAAFEKNNIEIPYPHMKILSEEKCQK